MPAKLEVIYTGDASKLITANKQAANSTKEFAEEGDKANKRLQGFQSGVRGLADDLGLPISPAALATAGIAAFGAAVVTSVNAAREGRAVQAQLAAVLESTGHAAGLSQEELNKHAEALQDLTNFDDEAVGSAQALLLTFTQIGREVFPQATKTTLDLATAFKMDASSAAVMLGKALNDPKEGVSALTRVGVSFTEQQKEQIKTMAEMGDVAGAQALILEEVNKQVAGSAEAARQADGGFIAFSNAVGNLSEAFGDLILKGNDNLGVMDGLIGVVENLTTTVSEIGEAIEQGPVTSFDALLTVVNPLSPILAALGVDIIPNVTSASEEMAEATTTLGEASAATAEQIQAQAEAASELAVTQAEYFNEVGDLEEKFNDKKQKYLDERMEALSKETENTTQNSRDLNQKLLDLQTEANEKKADLQKKAGEMTAAELQAEMTKVEGKYQRERQSTLDHYTELNQTVADKTQERLDELEKAHQEEQKKYDEHMQSLILKTVLQMAEANGELEALTGGVATNAEDAMALIEAGIIPVTSKMQKELKEGYGQLTKGSDNFRANEERNQGILQRLFGQTAQSQRGISYGGGREGPGFAGGADFIVPPGFANDSFPFRAESGERVQVTPANQVTHHNNQKQFVLNVYTQARSEDVIGSYRMMEAMAS